MKRIWDRLRGYQCSRIEARTLWYVTHGFTEQRPSDGDLRAIRRNPPGEELALLRAHLRPDLLSDRP
jgi:hypothetical protein